MPNQETVVPQAETITSPSSRPKSSPGDAIFAAVAKSSGLFVLLLLGAIIVVLFSAG